MKHRGLNYSGLYDRHKGLIFQDYTTQSMVNNYGTERIKLFRIMTHKGLDNSGLYNTILQDYVTDIRYRTL